MERSAQLVARLLVGVTVGGTRVVELSGRSIGVVVASGNADKT